MAKRTAKTKFNVMNVIKATGGGAVAEVVIDLAQKNVKVIQDTPMLASLIPAIIGSAGIYFTKDDNLDPVFYGMMGVAGSEIVDEADLLNALDGFSRVNYISPGNMPSQPMVSQGMIDDMAVMEEELDGMI